jgi:hypothetical protein
VIIGLPIAAGPFLYAFYWVFSRRVRWDAGIESLMSASSFSPTELARSIPRLNISLKDLIDRVNSFAATLGKPVIVRETRRAMILQARAIQSSAWIGILVGTVLSVSGGGYLPAVVAYAIVPVLLLRASKVLQPRSAFPKFESYHAALSSL